jgi:hypothetical protein
MLELREGNKEAPSADRPKGSPADEEREEASKAILCRKCETTISEHRHRFAADGESDIRAFANPHGLLREVVTLRKAWSLELESWASAEFTWFPGYVWRVASCKSCGTLLGWRFESEGEKSPSEFFGLLTASLSGL